MTRRPDLPTGTVTFVFTDIEGSTRLLAEVGADAYAAALAEHRRVLRDAFARHGGVEVDTQGDAFFVAFPTAPGALAAARDAQEALADGLIRVRMGIHTGTPIVAEEGYVGADVHRAARIAAAGHGGQVLVSAATATLTAEDGLRDLGPHRLKDLSAPERLFQVGEGDFPPLKTLYQTNLPVPLTPFLGRERELAEVAELVRRSDVRLLTLTGPGGTGKTRLAAQAAAELGDRYPDGVWWVPLASLRDPELVIDTAGRILGAKNGLAEHIAERHMLLLFDNFEQVVPAAPEVATLLGACPNLEVLLTSREPLHLSGEHEYPVPPLAPPEGFELFMVRARAMVPDFDADATTAQTVSAICRRLDDLPLAIELAAARVKALSAAQILERLERRLPLLIGGARDLPERQRTLRGAIEWSHELLTPDEQRIFRRLAVFRGGSTLEAAESVAEADIDTLQSLVDKSLLRHREGRFAMLETIREFAAERLEESGEADELRRRHAEYFLALAEATEPSLRGPRPKDALDLLEREHDNVRAALDRLGAIGEANLAQRLAGAVSRFWYLRGHLAEGRRRLDAALSLDDRPTAARAKAIIGASVMAFNVGDTSAARRLASDALELYRRLGDEWGAAYSVMMLGNAAAEEQDWATGRDLYAESLRRFTEIGDQDLIGIATDNLAWAAINLGDLPMARPLTEENLRQARARDDPRREAMALASLGGVARREGRIEEALLLTRQSARYWYDTGNRQFLARDLASIARLMALKGEPDQAVRLVGRSDALYEEIGAVEANREEFDAETLAIVGASLDGAAIARALDEGRSLSVDEAVGLALADATSPHA